MFDFYHEGNFGQIFTVTPWWAWVILLAFILAGIIASRIVHWILKKLGDRVHRTGAKHTATIFESGIKPAAVFIMAMSLRGGLAGIALTPAVRDFSTRCITLLNILAIGWFLYNLVEVLVDALAGLVNHTRSALDNQLIPLIRKALRMFLVVVLVLFTAENVFDANITAWLAGLGIAGLAFSLACQDSLKNLIGSLTIFMDRPFKVGDRIIVDKYDGVVEEIGFRSTKVRTGAGHLVTIPNAKIVDGSVENIQLRPAARRIMNLTLVPETSPQKLQRAVEVVRQILAESQIAAGLDTQSAPQVTFNDVTAAGLNLQIVYWYVGSAFEQHTHEFNMRLLNRLAEEQIQLEFPASIMQRQNQT